MYASAADYLGLNKNPVSNLVKEKYIPHPNHKPIEQYVPNHVHKPVHNVNADLNMVWKEENIRNTADPKVWGPAFWFTLHTSAAHYPFDASPLVRERMKHRILSIPYEISCANCRHHASAFIESHRHDLDRIVSGRHELGKFYVDFHNKVNERHNKPQWTYEKAYKHYSGHASVKHLKYE